MSGQKIKIGADLTDFATELNNLKSLIDQLGGALRSATGKADFNLNGSSEELKKILSQVDRVTRSLDAGDKKSKEFAKNAQVLAKALADAAKVSQKLETIGDSRNNHASNYLRTYSGELQQESSGVSAQAAIDRSREQDRQRVESERQARMNRMVRAGSTIGGAMIGGGGSYAAIGSTLGSLLPGPLGMIGGALGGALGGMAEKYTTLNKSEGIDFSKINRAAGTLETDFESLRESVRNTVSGLNISNTEAAKLALNFTKTAALSGDLTEDLSKSVRTSVGFAQGYGMESTQSAEFFAKMRLNGVAKNDNDNRRLATQIAESVGRNGMSSQMDSVLNSINGFVSRTAMQTMTTPDYGTFTSLITSMMGSRYAGLHGSAENSSNLLAQANAGVSNYDGMSEAVHTQWLQAMQAYFPNMRATDARIISEQGLTNNPSKAFREGPYHDNADPAEQDRMHALGDEIDASGVRNMLQLGLNWSKKIGGGNYDSEMLSIQRMFSLPSAQSAAALKGFGDNPKAIGDLEEVLKKNGIVADQKNIGRYAEIFGGSEEDRKKQYTNLKKYLPTEDIAAGDKALSAGGEKLRDFLMKNADKMPDDPGLKAQLDSVQIQNKVAASMDDLVGIENVAKEALLGILSHFDSDNPLLKKEAARKHNSTDVVSDIDSAGDVVSANQQDNLTGIVGRIKEAKTQTEKEMIARAALNSFSHDQGKGWPSNTRTMIDSALNAKPQNAEDQIPNKIDDQAPTIPAYVGGNDSYKKFAANNGKYTDKQKEIGQKITDEAIRQGVPPEKALALAFEESGLGERMTGGLIKKGPHKGDRAKGIFQYMANSSIGWDRNNDDENIRHGIADLKKNYKSFGDWGIAYGAHQAGAGHSEYKQGRYPNISDGYKTNEQYAKEVVALENRFKSKSFENKNDRFGASGLSPNYLAHQDFSKEIMPSFSDKNSESIFDARLPDSVAGTTDPRQFNQSFKGEFILRDSKNNIVADPIYTSSYVDKPLATGQNWTQRTKQSEVKTK